MTRAGITRLLLAVALAASHGSAARAPAHGPHAQTGAFQSREPALLAAPAWSRGAQARPQDLRAPFPPAPLSLTLGLPPAGTPAALAARLFRLLAVAAARPIAAHDTGPKTCRGPPTPNALA